MRIPDDRRSVEPSPASRSLLMASTDVVRYSCHRLLPASFAINANPLWNCSPSNNSIERSCAKVNRILGGRTGSFIRSCIRYSASLAEWSYYLWKLHCTALFIRKLRKSFWASGRVTIRPSGAACSCEKPCLSAWKILVNLPTWGLGPTKLLSTMELFPFSIC